MPSTHLLQWEAVNAQGLVWYGTPSIPPSTCVNTALPPSHWTNAPSTRRQWPGLRRHGGQVRVGLFCRPQLRRVLSMPLRFGPCAFGDAEFETCPSRGCLTEVGHHGFEFHGVSSDNPCVMGPRHKRKSTPIAHRPVAQTLPLRSQLSVHVLEYPPKEHGRDGVCLTQAQLGTHG